MSFPLEAMKDTSILRKLGLKSKLWKGPKSRLQLRYQLLKKIISFLECY